MVQVHLFHPKEGATEGIKQQYIHSYTHSITIKNIHVSPREGVGCLNTWSYGETEADVQLAHGLVLLPALSSLPAVGSKGIFSIIHRNDSLPSSTSAESRYLQWTSSQYVALWSRAKAASSLCTVPTTGLIVPLVDSQPSWQVSSPRKASEGTFKC